MKTVLRSILIGLLALLIGSHQIAAAPPPGNGGGGNTANDPIIQSADVIFDPNIPYTGGDILTITGDNFVVGDTEVIIGRTLLPAATIAVDGVGQTITVTFPTDSFLMLFPVGSYTIMVTTPDGSGQGTLAVNDPFAGGDLTGMYPAPDIAADAVTSAEIADNAVGTSELRDGSVSTDKISDSAVTSAKIQDGTIATADIASDAVTSDKIASGAVTSAEIGNGAVTNTTIADSSVTSAKILDGTIADVDINAAAGIAATKLDSAVMVEGENVSLLANDANYLASGDAAGGALAGAYPNPQIAADAVGTAAIADSAVTNAKIQDGTIVNDDIADGAVGSDKIADGTIVDADISWTAEIAVTKLDPRVMAEGEDVSKLGNITTQDNNTALGYNALLKNTPNLLAAEGIQNTAIGQSALEENTVGSNNTAIGYRALLSNTSGNHNSAIGYYALLFNTTGWSNTAIGIESLENNSTGFGNTALGAGALLSATGSGNTAIGGSAGTNAEGGNNNIYINNLGDAADSGVIKIGTKGNQTSAFIAGISGAPVNGSPVFVDDTTGQLGTGEVGTSGIADNAVTSAKIRDDTIQEADLHFDTATQAELDSAIADHTAIPDAHHTKTINASELTAGVLDNARLDATTVTLLGPSISVAELDFDPAEQTELDAHAADANAHHVKTVDASELTVGVLNNARLDPAVSLLGQQISLGELDFDPATQTELDAHEGNSSAHHSAFTAGSNSALGEQALASITTGIGNTAIGNDALRNDTTGFRNTAVGRGALYNNNGGSDNTAIGSAVLYSNTTGSQNTAVGMNALVDNQIGKNNTAIGINALFQNLASDNTAIGRTALTQNTIGSGNTALGFDALRGNISGDGNIGIGFRSGQNATDGSDNLFISNEGVATDSGVIKIGTQGTQTSTFIAGINNSTVAGQAVVVDNNGQLGTGVANALIVDSSGNVGIGTTPNLAEGEGIHIKANTKLNAKVTLEQGEAIGGINMSAYNYGLYLSSSREITFLPANSSAMTLTPEGRVGIGTAAPERLLHIKESITEAGELQRAAIRLESATGGAHTWDITSLDSGGGTLGTLSFTDLQTGESPLSLVQDGSVGIGTSTPSATLHVIGNILATGTITPSDARLKTGVTTLTHALEQVQKIRGVSFTWNEASEALGHVAGKHDIGVIAQEVEVVFPEFVATTGDYKAVDYSRLTAVLIEAVKELNTEKDALETRVEALEYHIREQPNPVRSSLFGLSTGWPLIGVSLILGLALGRRGKRQDV